MMHFTRGLALLAVVITMIPCAQAQNWPNKSVRTVVPFAPGAIGTDIVVRAQPDGCTILIGASSYAANAALYKLNYDPIKGFAPASLITRGPFVFSVHLSVKATNISMLVLAFRNAIFLTN